LNILVVVGYNPFIVKDGNAMRICSMLRELVIQGHKISLLIYTLPRTKYKKLIPFYGIKQYIFTVRSELLLLGFLLRQIFRVPVFSLTSSLIPPFYGFNKIVRKIIKNDRINIIQCENIYTFPQIAKCDLSIPIIVSALDVLYDRYRQALENMRVLKCMREVFLKWLQHMEIKSIKQSSVCVCVSDEDRNRFIKMGVNEKKLIVIHNGVDCDSIAPMSEDVSILKQLGLSKNDRILFFGGSGQLQNIRAVHDIIERIIPGIIKDFSNIKIIFTGGISEYIADNKLNELYPKNIINVGYVENPRNYYSLVDIVILPITIGSGTKLKVAEALAAGKAIISTNMGVVGYDVIDGKDVIIEDCIDKFSDRIKSLLNDPVLREKLGENARKKSLQYDWKFLIKKYSEIYQTIFVR